jgi:hypothetical protein
METTAICCFTLGNDILAHVNADFYRPDNAPTHGDDRVRVVGTKACWRSSETRYISLTRIPTGPGRSPSRSRR